MSFRDRIHADIARTFMNTEHFGEEHTWNGAKFTCVPDEETALKRKNNNVVDLSWDNNSMEILLYTPEKDFPGVLRPNEHVILDGRKGWKVLQFNEDGGMLSILLVRNDPKAVAM